MNRSVRPIVVIVVKKKQFVVGSSVEALVPGLNVPYGIQFTGMRESQHAKGGRGGGGSGGGPGWRQMGTKEDKRFCFASLPGAGGRGFMGQVRSLGGQASRVCGSCRGVHRGGALALEAGR